MSGASPLEVGALVGDALVRALPFVPPAAVAVVVGFLGVLYRRFRRTGEREIEPFTHFIWNGIRYYVGRPFWRRLAAESALRQYARMHLRTTARQMIVPAAYPVPLLVDRVYVPLLMRDASQEPVDHLGLLAPGPRRVIVLGDPGSGKSSLVKRLFRDACRRAASAPATAVLPVLVEMRTLVSALEAQPELDFLEAITGRVRRLDIYGADRAVERLRYGPGLLVLLDGLDEVPTHLAEQVQLRVLALLRRLEEVSPNSSIVLTTRTQHYLTAVRSSLKEQFASLAIQPFTQGDVYQFLCRWPYARDRSLAEEATRLMARIQQFPSLAEMCTNPLALAMYVARDQQTGGHDMPETRTLFYKELVTELLVKRRARADGPEASGLPRLHEVRSAVLGRISLDHLLNPDEAANSIPIARFRTVMREKLMLNDVDDSGVDQRMRELAVQTGLFTVEREDESLRFLHLSLCEYLAALEVVNSGEGAWRTVLGTAAGPVRRDEQSRGRIASRLIEVTAFAAGLAPRSQRDRMIADLLELDDTAALIRVAMETQRYSDAELTQAVLREIADIGAVDASEWDAAWFARLSLLVAALKDAANGPPWPSMAALPLAATLLSGLMNSELATERLIGPLCRIDPASAIDLASSWPDPRLRRVVAEAADDSAMLIGLIARGAIGDLNWHRALLDAGLMHRRVAQTLLGVATRDLPDMDRDSHVRGRWSGCWLIRNSLYGVVLDSVASRASNAAGGSDTSYELANRLVSMAPPRSRWLASTTPLSIAATVVGVVVLVVHTVVVRMQPESFTTSLAGAVLGISAGGFGTLVFFLLVGNLVTGIETMISAIELARERSRMKEGTVSVRLPGMGTLAMTVGGSHSGSVPADKKVAQARDVDLSVRRLRLDRLLYELLNLRSYPLMYEAPVVDRTLPGRTIRRVLTGVSNEQLGLLVDIRAERVAALRADRSGLHRSR